MNRRRTIVVGIAGMLAAPPIALAQKPQKVPRVVRRWDLRIGGWDPPYDLIGGIGYAPRALN